MKIQFVIFFSHVLASVVQAAMEKGDEKALKVYIQIGRFLAHAIPWYNEFYDYENMMILGRVTSGLGGSIILESAKRFLKDVYPEWAEKIDVFMPDEQARRLGQSVALPRRFGSRAISMLAKQLFISQ